MNAAVKSLHPILLQGLKEVLGTPSKPIPLHEPEFTGNESALVQDCLNSTFVSSVGKYVDQFEVMLAEYTGAKHAVAVVNGTAAMQIALKLAGVQPDDEVLVPALCFVATANAVAHCGAVPHFVDSHLDTMGMDPAALPIICARSRKSRRRGCAIVIPAAGSRAIVPMHTYGHPVDIGALLEVAGRYGLPIVEDAAESLGSTYQGRHTGTFGELGILSFNGNKIITTGGGGAILTRRSRAGASRQAPHHHGQASASLGVLPRRAGLELSHAESERRARLRADGAAAGFPFAQARARGALPGGVSRRDRHAIRARAGRMSQQLLAQHRAAGTTGHRYARRTTHRCQRRAATSAAQRGRCCTSCQCSPTARVPRSRLRSAWRQA